MVNLNYIEWIFFDMGSTLLDETQSFTNWFYNASKITGGELSPQDIEQEYCNGIINGTPNIAHLLKSYGFTGHSTSDLYPSELNIPYPECNNVLNQLSRNYKLGILANQKIGSESRLVKHGLQQYFDVIITSAEIGIKKPDPLIFSLALEKANCKPENAAMVGDRLDNDIFPAKTLGFTTVRILQGYGKFQIPKSSDYEPDFTIGSLSQILDIF